MVKIYTDDNCPYCNKLKIGLNKLKINFNEVNVDNMIYKSEVDSIFKMAGERVIPIIVIAPHLLVPKRTFNTIDDALKIISDLIKK